MKRIPLFLALGVAAWLMIVGYAYSAIRTPTPIVPPNETGEWDAMQQQVVDFARIKIGSCAVTTTGSEPNFTAVTCNGASGSVTTNANVTLAVVGNKDTVTITDNKVQAGDFVQCTLDSTGAAAGSTPICSAVVTTAGQVVFSITNLTVTSPAAPLKVNFLVMTQGNPN